MLIRICTNWKTKKACIFFTNISFIEKANEKVCFCFPFCASSLNIFRCLTNFLWKTRVQLYLEKGKKKNRRGKKFWDFMFFDFIAQTFNDSRNFNILKDNPHFWFGQKIHLEMGKLQQWAKYRNGATNNMNTLITKLSKLQ